ncbi:MAG: murein biosynthesis integral membrane protein MurJ [Pseudomonadota bacterium]|nr:murein biosynthesis integral membrane protein MurJ [Pseudomonadota bacterium]
MKLIKAMATVAGLTGLSRIAGFGRDILTAGILGAGPIADAFFVALKLPNLFRRVTAEGAFTVAFVPLYSQTLEKEGEATASRFAGNAFTIMLWTLLVFTCLAMMAMPWIINLIAPGFSDDPLRYPMSIELSRITFPYLLLMSLTALMGGILNAHDKFAPFAAAPILFNCSLIVALLCSNVFESAGHAMAYGVFGAGILQFLLLLFFIKKYSYGFRIQKPRYSPRIKKLFKNMVPTTISAGVMQINLFADMIIASLLPAGAISYLYYADRLNQLPLGMVGIAVGTALLPMLSKAIAAGDSKESSDLYNRAMEVCLLLALPAATGLFVLSQPIISTLFQHGEFTPEDSRMTARVLTAYAVGMPAYIFVKVYATAYWARQDTTSPMWASVIATVFNIALSLYLVLLTPMGVEGIALATALAGWLQIVILGRGLRAQEDTRWDARFKTAALKIFAASLAMAAALYMAMPYTTSFFLEDAALIQQITGLVILIGGGATIYAAVILGTGAVRINYLKKILKKARK